MDPFTIINIGHHLGLYYLSPTLYDENLKNLLHKTTVYNYCSMKKIRQYKISECWDFPTPILEKIPKKMEKLPPNGSKAVLENTIHELR